MKTSSAALAIAITAAASTLTSVEADLGTTDDKGEYIGPCFANCSPSIPRPPQMPTEFPSCATPSIPPQRLLVETEGSVVHYVNGTDTLAREEVVDAVQRALDGENEAELVEFFEEKQVTMVLALESDGMGVLAPDGLDGEFGIQNAFVKDYPDTLYRVVCPVKSDGAVCDLEVHNPVSENVCEFQDEDIPTQCMNQMYSVGLYARKGPHFMLGATAQGGVQDSGCPEIIGFETIRNEKKKLGLFNMNDIKEELDETPVHMLGYRELGAILEAEGQADSRDYAEFDLETNNCVHYAGSIWRNLGIQETNELAKFIIDHVLNDDNFEKFAMKHSRGIRHLAANVMGAKRALGGYISELVYSHFEL